MKRVFTSMDPLLVEQVRSVLENAGIRCHVPHRDLRSLAGAIPFSECWPEVCVVDDSQASAAERLIEELTAPRPPVEGLWRCPSCGETLSSRFTSCWKCAGEGELRSERAPADEVRSRLSARYPRMLLWIAVGLMAAVALSLAACSARNVPPPSRYAHVEREMGAGQGGTTHDVILTKLHESLRDMPPNTAAQRQVIIDVAYPASAEEFTAMGGWTLVLLSATSHIDAELPLKRAYVRTGGKDVDLQRASRFRCSALPREEDALIRTFGRHRCDALYYLPVAFTQMPVELRVDFARTRSGFVVAKFPMSSSHGSLPPGIDLKAPLGTASQEAATAFARREFPLIWSQ